MRWVLLGGALACACVTSWASSVGGDFSQHRVKRWGLEHGLPQLTISSMVKTDDGYLWVGTQKGIARFDGLRFSVLAEDGPPFLEESRVNSLVKGDDGTLWIGTSQGLAYYYRGAFGSYQDQRVAGNPAVGGLALDRAGALWIGVDGALGRYQDRRFEWFHDPNLAKGEVNGLAIDRLGRIWVAAKTGLRYFEDGKVYLLEGGEALDGHNVTTVFYDGKGKIWAGVEKIGLISISVENLKLSVFPLENQSPIQAICDRPDGGLWLGMVEKGLIGFEKGEFQIYQGQENWSDDGIFSLLNDNEGHLWMGTRYGLVQLTERVYQRFGETFGLVNRRMWTVYQDKQGSIWMGTDGGGLVSNRNGKIQTITEADGLPSNIVLSVFGQPDGVLWVGTKKGLARLKAGTVEEMFDSEGQPLPDVSALLVDSKQRVWAGTKQGLYLYEDRVLGKVELVPAAANALVRALVEDSQGRLWVGTNAGLFLRENNAFRRLTDEFLEMNDILSIFEDEIGDVWLGTYNQGLLRFRNESFRSITQNQGLVSNIIFSILPDDTGHFWLSTHRAFLRVDRAALNQVLEGKAEVVKPLVFGSDLDKEFGELQGGTSPSGWRSHDGKLLLPSSNGLLMVSPEKAENVNIPPRVMVENLVVDGVEMRPERRVKLSPGSKHFEFGYTGLSYLDADKLKFQVMLKPLDRQWQDMDFLRRKEYFNLPPGQYQFKVRAINAYGQRSENKARLRFYLEPRFYETEFFLLICIIGIGLLFTGLHQWRLRKSESRRIHLEKLVKARTQALEASNLELQKAQDRLVRAAHYAGKAEIATDVLHSVGNALNSVVVSTSLLEEQTAGLKTDLYEKLVPLLEKYRGQMDHYLTVDPRGKKVLPTMGKMGKALRQYREGMLLEIGTMKEMVHHIKQIIRDQQRHADMGMYFETVSLDQMVDEAIELQAGTLHATGVQIEKDIQEGIIVRVPKIAFLQVLINLIKNACEASTRLEDEKRFVTLKAFLKGPGWVHLEVSDFGLGIDQSDITRIFRQGYTTKPGANGFGLHFCGNIISELKGQISVRSDGEGRGATFLLDLPVAQTIES